MTNNPYVNTLIEMGYDKQDVEVTSTMFQKKEFPCVIHGRSFETEEQYNQELHEYMNGMWNLPSVTNADFFHHHSEAINKGGRLKCLYSIGDSNPTHPTTT